MGMRLSILRRVSNIQQTNNSNKCGGVGKLGNPHLKIWCMTVLYMPTSKRSHSSSTRIYLKLTKINNNVLDIENMSFLNVYIYIFDSR